MTKKSKKRSQKFIFIGLSILVVLAGLYLWHHYYDKPKIAVTATVHTPVQGTKSTPTTPQVSTNNLSSGGTTDNNGQTSGTLPPSSDWVMSTSGDITLQQPAASTSVKTGDTISGLANVSNVQFILTDNSVGQIDQGNLSVVNGKFSGTLQFTSHSSSGTLQVYYPNPSNGAEEDIINIDVNFSS